MSSLIPSFQKRNFTGSILNKNVKLRVNSMSWGAIGGCADASITAFGGVADLWELIELLRCPVVVRDEIARKLWWGYVAEATVRINQIEIGATLASMSNAVAVAYSYVQPGTQTVGARKQTAWTTDAASLAEYGRKEFVSRQGGLSDAAATSRRNAILTSRKWPQGVGAQFGSPRGRVTYSGAENSQSATLKCLGWWSTLDWRYASIASVAGPGYTATSATEQAVGAATGNTKAMQVFNLPGQAVNALGVQIYARKQGAPADNLVLSIYLVNDSDVPTGSALGTVTLAGSGLTTSLAWVGGTFVAEKELATGLDFALVVNRSGAIDASNYYVINVNTALGHTNGFFRLFDGTNWAARSPDADMPFVITVNNNVETTQQISDLVLANGEFITATKVEAVSGVILPSYRDGDTLVGDEIRALMESGGTNGRRLLSSVDSDRRVLIWEEPASTVCNYRMNSDGVLMDKILSAVDETTPPVGVWVRLVDVIPGNADVSKLNSPELQFIEGATWSVDGGLQLKFRGQPSIDDMFKVNR